MVSLSSPDQRERILAAALRILREDGSHALTVRRVAQMSDCSTTGIYTYFGGKQGLVDAIFIDGFERFGQALDDGVRQTTSLGLLDRAVAMGQAYRRFALMYPTQYQVMFTRAVRDYEPSDEAVAAGHRSFVQLVDLVQALVDGGVVEETVPTPELALHVWATVHGYVMLELVNPTDVSERAVTDRIFTNGLHRLFAGMVRNNG